MRDSSLKDQWLQDRLRAISDASVTVFGDFCVDAYWIIDSGQEEKSMETLRVVRRVRRQRYSLGGAGNIVANLVDLGVRQVRVVGLIGNDLFGQHMLQMLASSSAVDCRTSTTLSRTASTSAHSTSSARQPSRHWARR
jgi:bifunctional ADP-heptose synthase (sugar kinase/adenylyltransferase)